MEVKVRFRYNKVTGEVELFEVDHQGPRLSDAEHNREHDRVAADVAGTIARDPAIIEVYPGSDRHERGETAEDHTAERTDEVAGERSKTTNGQRKLKQ